MANRNLDAAKKAKNDEFYTQYCDIQKEVLAYTDFDADVFRDKTIYLNCDDPYESNFTRFFANNFNTFGIKKLILTSYFNSPIADTEIKFSQKSLIDGIPDKEISLRENSDSENLRRENKGRAIVITEVSDKNDDGVFNSEDMQQIVADNGGEKILKGDKNPDGSYKYFPGDFRSSECVEFLQQADIVITNPPFSLFREYVAQLFAYQKKFLIIGNMNAITYKEIFPKIKENKMWLGPSISSGDREFRVPDNYPLYAANFREDEKGRKFIRVKGVRWYTNLDHGKRHEKLSLMTMADNLKFNKKIQKSATAYKKYDNYDAIEVPFTDAIPSDFGGVMGVPISFLDKYNPEQFEIVGMTQRSCHDELPDTKKYENYVQMNKNESIEGSNGRKIDESPVIEGKISGKTFYKNLENNHEVSSLYMRIFLKFRESSANSAKISDNSEAKNSDDGENHF